MFYFTFGEGVSGVYEGQVIGVCKHLKEVYECPIRLVAFISIRGFSKQKQRIKKELPDAIVLPMLPKLQLWKLNSILLSLFCVFYRPKNMICRNVMATILALKMRKLGLLNKVCYDGRGAMAAEWNEYDVVSVESLKRKIFSLEQSAVNESDFRIAVSSELISYWEKDFGYNQKNHVIIPCTLSENFQITSHSQDDIVRLREELGYLANDVVFIYAGSTAGWQSFEILASFLTEALKKSSNNKVIFLSKEDVNNLSLKAEYPNQISIKWVKPDEVQDYLNISDYGLLLREQTITNQVAAPTKFAEYLASGLDVIISPGLGDYSNIVAVENCGQIISNEEKVDYLEFKARSIQSRIRNQSIAKQKFTKNSECNSVSYKTLVKQMCG
jgi:hypothetical protein